MQNPRRSTADLKTLVEHRYKSAIMHHRPQTLFGIPAATSPPRWRSPHRSSDPEIFAESHPVPSGTP
jgi:hypothetical protein